MYYNCILCIILARIIDAALKFVFAFEVQTQEERKLFGA